MRLALKRKRPTFVGIVREKTAQQANAYQHLKKKYAMGAMNVNMIQPLAKLIFVMKVMPL